MQMSHSLTVKVKSHYFKTKRAILHFLSIFICVLYSSFLNVNFTFKIGKPCHKEFELNFTVAFISSIFHFAIARVNLVIASQWEEARKIGKHSWLFGKECKDACCLRWMRHWKLVCTFDIKPWGRSQATHAKVHDIQKYLSFTINNSATCGFFSCGRFSGTLKCHIVVQNGFRVFVHC